MITLNDCISLVILQSLQSVTISIIYLEIDIFIDPKKTRQFQKILRYSHYQNSQLSFKITIISSEFNSSTTFAIRPSYSIPSPQLSPIPLKFPISFDPARNNSPARTNERKKERRKRCEKRKIARLLRNKGGYAAFSRYPTSRIRSRRFTYGRIPTIRLQPRIQPHTVCNARSSSGVALSKSSEGSARCHDPDRITIPRVHARAAVA